MSDVVMGAGVSGSSGHRVRHASGSDQLGPSRDTVEITLYWQETEFGLRPTIRISHLTIRETPTDIVMASKMLYATVNRSRSDGLSGFTGFFVRRRVRSEVQKGALASLEATKRILEAGAPR